MTSTQSQEIPARTVEKPAPTEGARTASKSQLSAEKLPLEAFAKLPFIEMIELSPNGQYFAGVFGVKGEQRILISPLNFDRTKIKMLPIPDETEISRIRWINDDNILISMYGLTRVFDDRWYISRIFGVNRKTGEFTKLLTRQTGQNAAQVIWTPSDGSAEILAAGQGSIYSDEDEFWPGVFRVNVETGKQKRVLKGKQYVTRWGADGSGNVRFGLGYNDRNQTSRLLYAKEGSRAFRTVDKADLGEEESLDVPFYFVPGTDNGWMIRDNAEGKSVIMEHNIATGEDVRTVYENPDSDVIRVKMSHDRSKLLGVRLNAKDNDFEWLDPKVKQAQEVLDEAATNANARIVSLSRDQTKMLVRIGTADNPGLIYFYDHAKGNLSKLASVNEAIGDRRLARAKYVQYEARDGLEIEGVLTLPRGRVAKDLPFIVLPHGGPWSHDSLSYDYWAQFLANMGYAVLQPNFRGSTGYGQAFVKKGQGQMGFAMQDDISDGVRWAVDQGIANPDRVCIMGASYGGYAAMWGIAKDPDQYRCAIAISGVAALRREVNDFGGSIRENLYRKQWRRMTPDFRAVSPLYAIDRIKAPLLLVHGKKDVTVDHGQSSKMYKAMKKAGKAVDFVSLEKADHYFTREADRMALLQSIENFLLTHNPPD
ncbi:alpha/beta hydrolase family protein [Parasphingorhabdus marina]|uniref:alpha/beta hydrolase family protein n=1 Tax=Parasphingorhabdus marina TaxID=394732 RepID=UPI001160FFE2|nr:S9 family peptidase [Parasphingorhabdus marina]